MLQTAAGDRRETAAPPDTPQLRFGIESVAVVEFAAVPTLAFTLSIDDAAELPIRSILLQAQVRIAALKRAYDGATRERLRELFGTAEQWGAAGQSLLWTQAVTVVRAFTGRTEVQLPVTCTYDFEAAVAKYFHVVSAGEIPIEVLFSGTVFYSGDGDALRTCLIPWHSEAAYRLPAGLWRAAMDRYFPNSAWLRLRRDAFDRLYAFKRRRALPSWEAALDALLAGERSAGD